MQTSEPLKMPNFREEEPALMGRVAMVGGLARVAQDIPPFVMVDGDSSLLVGLNRVGLRRAGFDHTQISEL